MLQKEAEQRPAVVPGNSIYGRLAIIARYFCQLQPLVEVGPGSFKPAPKVDSAIVRLIPYRNLPHPAKDIKTLQQVARSALSACRKTLAGLVTVEQLQGLGLNDGLRPENLALANYVAIADTVTDQATPANQ